MAIRLLDGILRWLAGKPLRWLKKIAKLLPSLLSAILLPAAIAFTGLKLQDAISQREIRTTYTELAISLLTEADPEKIDPALRKWAAELLQKNSPIPFRQETIDRLADGSSYLPSDIEKELRELRELKVRWLEREAIERDKPTIIGGTMPSFIGVDKEEALRMERLGRAGTLNISFSYKPSSEPRDTVIGQDPAPGTTITDPAVEIILSEGNN